MMGKYFPFLFSRERKQTTFAFTIHKTTHQTTMQINTPKTCYNQPMALYTDTTHDHEYTFYRETTPNKDLYNTLLKEERESPVTTTYTTVRDLAVFTPYRLILEDTQGIGNKKERLTIPYTQILAWATENAGKTGLSGELVIWTRLGTFKINLRKGIDIDRLDRILSIAIFR